MALTEGPLRDAEHGGWRSSTDDDTKAAYVHAFVLLAGSTAATAGTEGGAALLADAVGIWQDRFWDEDAGLAVEEWDRAWSRLDDYRGLNANMHGVEASLAAADALPADEATAARLREQAAAHHRAGVRLGPRPRTGGCPSTSPQPGSRCPTTTATGRPTRSVRSASPSGTSSSGRGWPCTCAQDTADPPGWLLDDAVALFDAAAQRGWAADGHDGFPYTLDWDDRPVVGARMHWVLCEAVAAAAALAEVTGEQRYREDAARWRAHGEQAFLDPGTGSWHHELTPTGEVGTGTWAGQPDAYHLAQMLLLDGRPVRGSVAAALR